MINMTVDYKFHELANAFPLLEGAEFDELVASIRAHGQLEKIIVFEDRILDGRNRYRACLAAGVEPHSEDFEGTFEEARDLVIDANLRRRHLDASQRALIAARLATMPQGRPTESGKFAGFPSQEKAANLPLVSQAVAAERLNVSERSVRDARKVIDKGTPELVQAVERGEVAVSVAAKVASLPRDVQAARIAEPLEGTVERPAEPTARPLRNLENLSGGELARWIKITTPNDRPHVIRILEMAAAILRDELEAGTRTIVAAP
jgi:ParB-like nuclease family protein